jgi:uncharacterized protein
MKISTEQLILLQQYFAAQPVLRAYLFGSYAREVATPESDIDILVELDYEQLIGLEFVQMHLDLQNMFHKKVDLISANGLSKYLVQNVNQEKKLIYAR